MWRLVYSEKFTYTEVKNMTFPELYEAEEALKALDKLQKAEMDKIKAKK
jgi:hypothetical protein